MATSPPQENQNIAAQQKEPMRIIEGSLKRSLPSEQQVGMALNALADMLKLSGNKLVHLGNTVFLVMVTGPGQVEVHTFSEDSPQGLARNFVNLTKYLKNIGVKTASTYSDDPRFQKIAEMTQLPVKTEQTMKRMGKKMTPVYQYTMEF